MEPRGLAKQADSFFDDSFNANQFAGAPFLRAPNANNVPGMPPMHGLLPPLMPPMGMSFSGNMGIREPWTAPPGLPPPPGHAFGRPPFPMRPPNEMFAPRGLPPPPGHFHVPPPHQHNLNINLPRPPPPVSQMPHPLHNLNVTPNIHQVLAEGPPPQFANRDEGMFYGYRRPPGQRAPSVEPATEQVPTDSNRKVIASSADKISVCVSVRPIRASGSSTESPTAADRPFDEKSVEELISEFARHANPIIDDISNKEIDSVESRTQALPEAEEEELYAVMPPIETFMGTPAACRRRHFYHTLQKGDLLIGKIHRKTESGFIISVLCLDGGRRLDMTETDVNVFCQYSQAQQLTAHEKVIDSYEEGDHLRVVVTSMITESEKVFVSMKEEALPEERRKTSPIKMGLISEEELPSHYHKIVMHAGNVYSDVMSRNLSFNNPSAASFLASQLIRSPERRHLSFLPSLKDKVYSESDLANSMRKTQSAKWASKSLEQGIRFMRQGEELMAHQQLNKALQIDPDSVDAFVARGCLYANNNNLKKALDDFERALDLNPNHANARKYMSDTLLEFAKSLVDGDLNLMEVSLKRAIAIDLHNQEAKDLLKTTQDRIRARQSSSSRHSNSDRERRARSPSPKRPLDDTSRKLKNLLSEEKSKSSSSKHKSSKHKSSSAKKKKRKRRRSSSSSSSTDTYDSDSSSESRRHKSKKKSKSSKDRKSSKTKKRDSSPAEKQKSSSKIIFSPLRESEGGIVNARDHPRSASKIEFSIASKNSGSNLIGLATGLDDESVHDEPVDIPSMSPVRQQFSVDTSRPMGGLIVDKSTKLSTNRRRSPSVEGIPGISERKSRSRSRSRDRGHRDRDRRSPFNHRDLSFNSHRGSNYPRRPFRGNSFGHNPNFNNRGRGDYHNSNHRGSYSYDRGRGGSNFPRGRWSRQRGEMDPRRAEQLRRQDDDMEEQILAAMTSRD